MLLCAWSDGDVGATSDAGTASLRCASVLKPLYAWAVGPSSYAEPAIRFSDNDATDRLITTGGGLYNVLEAVASLTGVRWEPGPTWGRVLIGAHDTLQAYIALQQSSHPWARQIRRWMHEVAPDQTLGLLTRWQAAGFEPAGIKLGWDLLPDEHELRTHAVIISKKRVRVCFTSTPVRKPERDAWHAALVRHGDGPELLTHHAVALDDLHRGLGL